MTVPEGKQGKPQILAGFGVSWIVAKSLSQLRNRPAEITVLKEDYAQVGVEGRIMGVKAHGFPELSHRSIGVATRIERNAQLVVGGGEPRHQPYGFAVLGQGFCWSVLIPENVTKSGMELSFVGEIVLRATKFHFSSRKITFFDKSRRQAGAPNGCLGLQPRRNTVFLNSFTEIAACHIDIAQGSVRIDVVGIDP